MKKIRISDLPLCTALNGLFTIGTDANNESVKVSLEFLKEGIEGGQEAAEAAAEAKAAAAEATAAASTLGNVAILADTGDETDYPEIKEYY